MAICSATKKDGSPCGAQARPERDFCFSHDPELAEKRLAAHVRGGQNKATIRRIERSMPPSMEPVLRTLCVALEGLETGDTDPKTATAMSAVATAILKVYEVSLRRVRDPNRRMPTGISNSQIYDIADRLRQRGDAS